MVNGWKLHMFDEMPFNYMYATIMPLFLSRVRTKGDASVECVFLT